MTLIKPFHPGTSKDFSVLLKRNGVAQDISSDTVTLTMKDAPTDTDAEANLQQNADVASQGASGIAVFELTPAMTKVVPEGTQYVDIQWNVDATSEEFVVYSDTIKMKTRVSDTPS